MSDLAHSVRQIQNLSFNCTEFGIIKIVTRACTLIITMDCVSIYDIEYSRRLLWHLKENFIMFLYLTTDYLTKKSIKYKN